MAACTAMASAVVFTIGLQIGHKDVPWCPSQQRHGDAVYGALVREKGREPSGCELWQAYDRSLGMRPLHGLLNTASYCALRELTVDGTPIPMP